MAEVARPEVQSARIRIDLDLAQQEGDAWRSGWRQQQRTPLGMHQPRARSAYATIIHFPTNTGP